PEALHAEALGSRVSAVLGARYAFFVRHFSPAPLRLAADVQDLHPRQGVPVTDLPAVLLPPLVDADLDLGASLRAENLDLHRSALDQRLSDFHALPIRDQKHAVE